MKDEPNALSTSRRTFLKHVALAPVALTAMTRLAGAADSKSPQTGKLKFGVIADIHQDVMPDGIARVTAFISAMKELKPDLILNLGDFCQPHARNKPFFAAWNAFPGPRYHVLGNHDMDGGYKREQAVAYLGMPDKHYAFTSGPVRFIVLDGNEPGGKMKGYARNIGRPQLNWLDKQMTDADRPVIVFVHQPIDTDDHNLCVENSAAVRAVLEKAQSKNPGRVLAVFCGHLHEDYVNVVNGITYIQINSASYQWLGTPKTSRETYPHDVHLKHPSLVSVAAYRDPLWAVVKLDLKAGEMSIEGRRSEWVGPDPWKRGAVEKDKPRDRVHPYLSDRTVKV